VRVGNAASSQVQNDVYGSIVLTAAQMFWDSRLSAAGDAALYDQLRAVGDIAGQAQAAGAGMKKLLASASTVANSAVKAAAGALGEAAFPNEFDPNIYPAAQRLRSMGFEAGEPKDNRRTPQFTAALMEFQTWCKEQGNLANSAGGPLGDLTSPGGMLGGGSGPLGDVAKAVAGPLLAAVGLTAQLDEPTIDALKKTHGC